MNEKTPDFATLKLHHLARKRLREHPFSDHRRTVIYGVLIDHMDIDRICWPGAALIAREAHCAKRTVLKIIKEFESEGVVYFIDQVVRGGRRPRRIRVNFESLAHRVAVQHECTANGEFRGASMSAPQTARSERFSGAKPGV